MKSRRGVASKAQKYIRAEMLAAGVRWWMCRSARSALTALYPSGVPFRRPWNQPQLEKWEGPSEDPSQRLPQHPVVARERRAARQRWKARKRESAMLAARSGVEMPAMDDARRVNVAAVSQENVVPFARK